MAENRLRPLKVWRSAKGEAGYDFPISIESEYLAAVVDEEGRCVAKSAPEYVHVLAAAPELHEALEGVFGLIESGQLRRNTSDDPNPDWAMRQIPFVLALAKAQEALTKARGETKEVARVS